MPVAKNGDPYYLRNFHRLAETALNRDAALFTPWERDRIASVRGLPDPARRLLLRLAGRREGWLRCSQLRYAAEIPLLDDALSALAAACWLSRWPPAEDDDPPPLPPAELLATLTIAEGRHLLRGAGLPQAGSAPQLAARLATALGIGQQPAPGAVQLALWSEDTSLRQALARLDDWWRLEPRRLFRLLELAFFGNRHQDLSQFVLADLGHQRFERVHLTAASPWASRAEALAVLSEGETLDRLREDLEELRRALRGWRRGQPLEATLAAACEAGLEASWRLAQPPTLLPAPRLDPLSGAAQLRRIRLRALLAHAALLERLGRPQEAAGRLRLALEGGLEGRRRGETWLRLAIDLRQAGRSASALEVCRQGLQEPLGPVARRELALRAGEVEPLREPPVVRWTAPLHPGHRGGRTLLQGARGAALTVEELVLERRAAEGWRGLHAENALLRALVGLACWTLIFAPAPGAWLHAYQVAPRDWGHPDFLARRPEAWARTRERLQRSRHHAGVRERLRSKAGLANPLVDWTRLADPGPAGGLPAGQWRRGLEVLLTGVPGPALAEYAERLLAHPADCGHGLPDLLLWREDEEGRVLEWMLSEVKGPGDRLSTAQRLWLDRFLARGLPVEVVLVEALPD
jgi:hypothetical protein